ncbi:MAG: hypothetical protein K2X01_07060 [Cyanobacteria bacterium]|nr:hypothetical protein [Cyanobacteriota bacterium]
MNFIHSIAEHSAHSQVASLQRVTLPLAMKLAALLRPLGVGRDTTATWVDRSFTEVGEAVLSYLPATTARTIAYSLPPVQLLNLIHYGFQLDPDTFTLFCEGIQDFKQSDGAFLQADVIDWVSGYAPNPADFDPLEGLATRMAEWWLEVGQKSGLEQSKPFLNQAYQQAVFEKAERMALWLSRACVNPSMPFGAGRLMRMFAGKKLMIEGLGSIQVWCMHQADAAAALLGSESDYALAWQHEQSFWDALTKVIKADPYQFASEKPCL